MKKLLIALAAVLVTASSYGQGTIFFSTKVGTSVDAPVTLPDGTGPGPDYTAQLFLVGAGGSLTPLTPATTFRDGSKNPTAAKYVTIPAEQVVTVPGVGPAGSATVELAAWKTSLGSFDAAKAAQQLGISAPLTVNNLGGGALPPPNLVGLQGFVIPVPEPSTIALGILGASALLLRRRK
jgi:hypothetical protein